MVLNGYEQVTFRPKVPVGACMDIPTGSWMEGSKGEMILNGGVSTFTAITGINNSYKSTIMNYIAIVALDRMYVSCKEVTLTTYDTEGHMDLNRLNGLSITVARYLSKTPTYDNTWTVYDKSIMSADEFHNAVNEHNKTKTKTVTYTAFTNPHTGKPLVLLVPEIIIVDSFSKFNPKSIADIIEKAGEKGKETIYLKDGLFKTRFLDDMLMMSNKGNIMFIMSAHLGEGIDMSGMFEAGPLKKAQFLKGNQKIKRVPDDFYNMSTILWQSIPSLLKDSKGIGPEYPKKQQQELINNKQVTKELATELQLITLRALRNKGGKSGFDLKLVVSQEGGVLPSLTEFHHIKSNKYGISGNNISYHIDLYPNVTLGRTTVRDKLDTDKKLCRAINITSEMKQIEVHHPIYRELGLTCTPEELYNDIKKLGYDWDMILGETRGWWTIDNYNDKLPKYLSTLDLLRIRKGEYTPYWKGK